MRIQIAIDFANSKVIDHSVLKAIEDIAERYSKIGKQVKLRHLTKDCHRLLRKTGQLLLTVMMTLIMELLLTME